MDGKRFSRMALAASLALFCTTTVVQAQFVDQRPPHVPPDDTYYLAQRDSEDLQRVAYASDKGQAGGCDGGCSDSLCDSCQSDCYCCPLFDENRCPNWYVGTEFTLLALDTDQAGQTASVVGNGANVFGNSASGDLDGVTYAPRIWVGRQFNEWGVVARFWYLSDTDGDATLPPAGAISFGDAFAQRVKMYNVDLEVTRSGCWNAWKVDGSAGVRYASFENTAASSTAGFFNGTDSAFASASSGSSFGGTGLTFALNGRRPLGCNNLYLFASGRGSVLWGDSASFAATQATVTAPGAFASDVSAVSVSGAATDMWIGEFQVGVQWEYELACLPAVAFVRTAFEYQHWDIGGDGLVAAGSLAVVNATGAEALATSGASSVDLYGVSVATGLTW